MESTHASGSKIKMKGKLMNSIYDDYESIMSRLLPMLERASVGIRERRVDGKERLLEVERRLKHLNAAIPDNPSTSGLLLPFSSKGAGGWGQPW